MDNNTCDNYCSHIISCTANSDSSPAFYDATGIHNEKITFSKDEIECYNSYKWSWCFNVLVLWSASNRLCWITKHRHERIKSKYNKWRSIVKYTSHISISLSLFDLWDSPHLQLTDCEPILLLVSEHINPLFISWYFIPKLIDKRIAFLDPIKRLITCIQTSSFVNIPIETGTVPHPAY